MSVVGDVSSPALFIGTNGIVSSFKVNQTGQIYHLWKTQLSRSSGFVIIHCDSESDVLYAGKSGHLYALNSKTGDILWKTSLNLLGCGSVDIKLVGSIIVCSCVGYVYGISTDGKKLWECSLVGGGHESVTLAQRGGIIYALTKGYAYAISGDNGNILWKNSNEGHGYHPISMAFLSEKSVSFGMRSYLRRVNVESGEKIGSSFDMIPGANPVSQLIFQNCLYSGTAGVISAHNLSDFSIIWKKDVKFFVNHQGVTLVPYTSSQSYTPCILAGLSGDIFCLHAHSGVIQWSFNLEIAINGGFISIFTYGGTIIAGPEGKLYLIDGDTGMKISEDELKGFGNDNMCIVSKHVPMDQQSSNMIVSCDYI